MSYNFPVRLWVVVIAIILALVIYVYLVKPALIKYGILRTQECLQIQYQQYKNSVLTHLLPQGVWVWYDGKNVMVYGLPTGQVCNVRGFEPAYIINARKNKIEGWTCVRKIETVQEFYNDKKCPMQYIFRRKVNPNFDVYDLINLLSDERIITLKGAPECKKDSDCPKGDVCQVGSCTVGFKAKSCKTTQDCEQGDTCIDGVCVALSECQQYSPHVIPPAKSICSVENDFLVYSDSSLATRPSEASKSNINSWKECQSLCASSNACEVWEYDGRNKKCYTWSKGVPTSSDDLVTDTGKYVGVFKSAPTANIGGTVCQNDGDCTWPSVCKNGICKPSETTPTVFCEDVFKDCPRGSTCGSNKKCIPV